MPIYNTAETITEAIQTAGNNGVSSELIEFSQQIALNEVVGMPECPAAQYIVAHLRTIDPDSNRGQHELTNLAEFLTIFASVKMIDIPEEVTALLY